jgi:ABC-type uncharacterized transport system permease subunit
MLSFLISAIRLGMTFLLGSTGETITEKAGHLNLGTPGVMCVGASCGCWAEYLYMTSVGRNVNPVLAILIPVIATFAGAALMGVLFCFLTVTLKSNQNVTGLALTTLGVGISNYMIAITGPAYSRGTRYFTANLPFADKLGWPGQLLFSHGILVYIAIAIALTTSYIFNKTKVGLQLRAVGEDPATADAAGINVTKYRYIATCIGCGISGLGGLSFVMDYLHGNWEYCIDSIGWLAIALVIFTVWKPNIAIAGSIIFGALYIASSYITGITTETKEIFKMLPYVVTIAVLLLTSIMDRKDSQPPKSLGLTYFREER